jgi:hypothetical protein
MRQIEQVGQMLAHILGLAKGGRGDEALGMFDEAYKPLTGVGSRVVAVLDDGQLIDLLTSGSNPDMRRVALALQLLKTEADLYRGAGQAGEAAVRYRRAVALAGCLAARSERLLDHELAAGLLERAEELALTDDQRLAVARVLEALGRYADAEDALFELIDERPGLLPAPAAAGARGAGGRRPDPRGGQRHPWRAPGPAGGRRGRRGSIGGPALSPPNPR